MGTGDRKPARQVAWDLAGQGGKTWMILTPFSYKLLLCGSLSRADQPFAQAGPPEMQQAPSPLDMQFAGRF